MNAYSHINGCRAHLKNERVGKDQKLGFQNRSGAIDSERKNGNDEDGVGYILECGAAKGKLRDTKEGKPCNYNIIRTERKNFFAR
jgi:hypothetical protein